MGDSVGESSNQYKISSVLLNVRNIEYKMRIQEIVYHELKNCLKILNGAFYLFSGPPSILN